MLYWSKERNSLNRVRRALKACPFNDPLVLPGTFVDCTARIRSCLEGISSLHNLDVAMCLPSQPVLAFSRYRASNGTVTRLIFPRARFQVTWRIVCVSWLPYTLALSTSSTSDAAKRHTELFAKRVISSSEWSIEAEVATLFVSTGLHLLREFFLWHCCSSIFVWCLYRHDIIRGIYTMTVNEKVEDLSHRGECITGRSEIWKIETSCVSYVFEEHVSPRIRNVTTFLITYPKILTIL